MDGCYTGMTVREGRGERERVVLDPNLTSGWMLYGMNVREGERERERELSLTPT